MKITNNGIIYPGTITVERSNVEKDSIAICDKDGSWLHMSNKDFRDLVNKYNIYVKSPSNIPANVPKPNSSAIGEDTDFLDTLPDASPNSNPFV